MFGRASTAPRSARFVRHSLPAGLALLLSALPAPAAAPADPATKAQVIGQPAALLVQPEAIALNSPRATQQVVVTGKYADGSVRDLTAFCDLALEAPDVATVETGGFLLPKKSGATALVVKAAGQAARVPVTVTDFDKP